MATRDGRGMSHFPRHSDECFLYLQPEVGQFLPGPVRSTTSSPLDYLMRPGCAEVLQEVYDRVSVPASV
jgi:hypothetical protein